MPEADGGADGGSIRARAFWSGALSFGLVSIPVNLLAATRGRGVSLRMLDDDGTPLARRYYDPETGEDVPRDRIVRGYEVADGEYVVLTDEELEALEPDRTREIDLRRFVDRDELDPIYFERAYFLTPAGPSAKAYRLLAAVMEETNRAGIATFVMRTKEYLVAIVAENGILRAETLRFADEIRDAEDVGLPEEPPAPDPERVRKVAEAIEKRTRKTLDESELADRYAERLLDLVDGKRAKGEDVVSVPGAVEEAERGADVIDLMEVLKRSLQGTGRERGAAAPGGELGDLTKPELYDRAKALDIPGRSSMTKAELIRAIRRSA